MSIVTERTPVRAAENPALSVVVLSSGHGPSSGTARLGQTLGDATADALLSAGRPAVVEHVEVRRVAAAIVRALTEGEVEPNLASAIATIQRANALVVVTPTVNASFSGLLKAFLDVLPANALRSVPTTIAATGGTMRHTLVLDQAVRPMLGYQRAIVLPTCLFVTADEWDGTKPSAELAARIAGAGAELAAFTRIHAG